MCGARAYVVTKIRLFDDWFPRIRKAIHAAVVYEIITIKLSCLAMCAKMNFLKVYVCVFLVACVHVCVWVFLVACARLCVYGCMCAFVCGVWVCVPDLRS